MANGTANTFPSTGLFDIARLIGGFGRALVRHPRSVSPGLVLSNWIWGLTRRRKSENIVVNLGIRKILLVTGRDLSNHILQGPPNSKTYIAGTTKKRGMSYLATDGLTICQDEQWQRLRALNEQVLSMDTSTALQQSVLDQVHQAFSGRVSSVEDLRESMGRTMLGVVFGGAPAHLVEDIQVLFGYVQSPLKRLVLGRRQRGRHLRFYATIQQMWAKNEQSQDSNLMARACSFAQGGDFDADELIQQVPHWMFTFTGSGTDLLARTLAMLGSRPQVGDKVRDEIGAAGPLDEPGAIGRLPFLEACLLETCRLFPPVTRTIHVAPAGDTFGGVAISPGMEIWHYFPASYRDTSVDSKANDFEPLKWINSGDERRSAYPNFFLSGARACPGEDLILFICKAAIAILMGQDRLRPGSGVLASDPLPFSFPSSAVKF